VNSGFGSLFVPLYGVFASNTTHKTVEKYTFYDKKVVFGYAELTFTRGCGRQRPTTAVVSCVNISYLRFHILHILSKKLLSLHFLNCKTSDVFCFTYRLIFNLRKHPIILCQNAMLQLQEYRAGCLTMS
jgi:hypothetical protein